MINPQKFARKYARVILGTLVAVMAISLVLWIPGVAPGDESDPDAPEGRIYDDIVITRAQFFTAAAGALVHFRWAWFQQPTNRRFYPYIKPGEWDETQRRKKAWEYIVLLEEANRQQITCSRDEAKEHVNSFFFSILGPQMTADRYRLQVQGMFEVPVGQFEQLMADVIRVEKILDLLAEANFKLYGDVYGDVLKENRQVRVRVAAFDPRNFQPDLQPVRPDEVLKHYEEQKKQFEVPKKAQVEYVFASWEEFKNAIQQPTEDDLKEYYEKNKRQFPKEVRREPEDHEGHDHEKQSQEEKKEEKKPQEEYKSFDEVRIEVYDKIVEERAKKLAYELILKVNSDLGKELETKKEKDIRLDQLAERFPPVRHGISTSFDARGIDDVEKAENLGAGTRLGEWAFSSATDVYELSKGVLETAKGYAIFQLKNRKDPYFPGLTKDIDKRIRIELSRRQMQTRARREAERIQKILETKGYAAARAATNAPFEMSAYFNLGGNEPIGLKEQALHQAVRNNVRNLVTKDPPDVGKCVVVDGGNLTVEKRYWSFLVQVEDAVTTVSETIQDDFVQRYRDANGKFRVGSRAQVISGLLADAHPEDFQETKKAEEVPAKKP